MPSRSYGLWRTVRAAALDEMVEAHAAVGGTARGRRYATQQINRAYAVLLAAEFQGFCRDLHSECVAHLIKVMAPPTKLEAILQRDLTRGRLLDRGNAQPGSLGADFGRLNIEFWTVVNAHDARSISWRASLESLNEWRNAIAHQDFTSPRLGGIIILHLRQVERWRAACSRLARAIDEVLGRHLNDLTGSPPW